MAITVGSPPSNAQPGRWHDEVLVDVAARGKEDAADSEAEDPGRQHGRADGDPTLAHHQTEHPDEECQPTDKGEPEGRYDDNVCEGTELVRYEFANKP
jgi:hypothetical protein